MGEGLLIGLLLFPSITEVIISFGKIWLYLDSIFKELLGFFILLEINEYIPKVVVRRWVRGFKF